MLALNYAGILMSECYTAIKNIAKKRVDKVLAYKEKFIKGFSDSIVKDDGKTPKEAEELSNKLWQIVEDSRKYATFPYSTMTSTAQLSLLPPPS